MKTRTPEEEVESLKAILKAMALDLKKCSDDIQNNPDEIDFYTRSAVRALASWIEGTIWAYKEIFRRLESQ